MVRKQNVAQRDGKKVWHLVDSFDVEDNESVQGNTSVIVKMSIIIKKKYQIGKVSQKKDPTQWSLHFGKMQIYLIVRELKLKMLLKEFPAQNNYTRLCFLRITTQKPTQLWSKGRWIHPMLPQHQVEVFTQVWFCRHKICGLERVLEPEEKWESNVSPPHFSFSCSPEHLQQHIRWNPCIYGVVAKPKVFETYVSLQLKGSLGRR